MFFTLNEYDCYAFNAEALHIVGIMECISSNYEYWIDEVVYIGF